MGNFGPSWTQSYASLHLRIHSKSFFVKFCSVIGNNKYFLLGQMGNFGTIVVQNYASLYHRICSKDFVQTL